MAEIEDISEYIERQAREFYPFLTPQEAKTIKGKVKILSKPRTLAGKFGNQVVIDINAGNNNNYTVRLTRASMRNIAKLFGTDTESWIGKRVGISVDRVIVRGERKYTITLAPEAEEE